jgi:hypothetical protein
MCFPLAVQSAEEAGVALGAVPFPLAVLASEAWVTVKTVSLRVAVGTLYTGCTNYLLEPRKQTLQLKQQRQQHKDEPRLLTSVFFSAIQALISSSFDVPAKSTMYARQSSFVCGFAHSKSGVVSGD